MDAYRGKYGRKVKNTLSVYFDESISDWLKSKRKLRRKVKRCFIEEMRLEFIKLIKEDEDRMLYGDQSGVKPVGILNASNGGAK